MVHGFCVTEIIDYSELLRGFLGGGLQPLTALITLCAMLSGTVYC